jgi:hypothetical protein
MPTMPTWPIILIGSSAFDPYHCHCCLHPGQRRQTASVNCNINANCILGSAGAGARPHNNGHGTPPESTNHLHCHNLSCSLDLALILGMTPDSATHNHDCCARYVRRVACLRQPTTHLTSHPGHALESGPAVVVNRVCTMWNCTPNLRAEPCSTKAPHELCMLLTLA